MNSMVKLLQVNPRLRPRVQECMSEEWFGKSNCSRVGRDVNADSNSCYNGDELSDASKLLQRIEVRILQGESGGEESLVVCTSEPDSCSLSTGTEVWSESSSC